MTIRAVIIHSLSLVTGRFVMSLAHVSLAKGASVFACEKRLSAAPLDVGDNASGTARLLLGQRAWRQMTEPADHASCFPARLALGGMLLAATTMLCQRFVVLADDAFARAAG